MSSRQLDAPSPHRQPGHAPRLAGDVGSGAAPWIRSPGRRAVADGYTIDDSCFPIDPRVLSDRPTRAFRSAFYTRYSHRRDAFLFVAIVSLATPIIPRQKGISRFTAPPQPTKIGGSGISETSESGILIAAKLTRSSSNVSPY